MIRYFDSPSGTGLEQIYGQNRLAYATSGSEDFEDMLAWAQRGGYQGETLTFYDFETGGTYTPFEKRRDVLYSPPFYAQGFYYFLQGDFAAGVLTLYRYRPEDPLKAVTTFCADEVSLCNLVVIGNPVWVLSQDREDEENRVTCYFPERFSFSAGPEESVAFIERGKVYLSRWIEEGWDEERDRATDAYRYYEKVVVRDFTGRILSEELGSLTQCTDGTWWIS